jgi:hypothetical protein
VLLDMTGAGTARVTVYGLLLRPDNGVTGIALPANSAATSIESIGGAVGARLDGSLAEPASLRSSYVQAGLAVDAPGRAIVENSRLFGPAGVSSHGGDVDVGGGEIHAFRAVSAPRGRVAGTLLVLDPLWATSRRPGVALEALCDDATSADAELAVTNATVAVGDNSDVIGARASARGGDGTACDAHVSLSSTNLWGTRLALDAHGEAGSGATPQDGVARIDASYSNFSVARIARTGPTEVDISSPGGNMDANPLFRDRFQFALLWPSPLIDRGDPAAPTPFEEPWVRVIHDRRDIGHWEYGFEPPMLNAAAEPAQTVRPHRPVRLSSHVFDRDGDGVSVVWRLSNGLTVTDPVLTRRYAKPGTYTERVTARDASGLTDAATVTVRVARQRLSGLLVYPDRFRTPRDRARGRAAIWITARAHDRLGFRVERAKRSKRRLRWVRVRGRGGFSVEPGRAGHPFNGWLGNRRLRPGRYRLVVKAAGLEAKRTGFRILR